VLPERCLSITTLTRSAPPSLLCQNMLHKVSCSPLVCTRSPFFLRGSILGATLANGRYSVLNNRCPLSWRRDVCSLQAPPGRMCRPPSCSLVRPSFLHNNVLLFDSYKLPINPFSIFSQQIFTKNYTLDYHSLVSFFL